MLFDLTRYLNVLPLLVLITTSAVHSKSDNKPKKRQAHRHKHHQEVIQIASDSAVESLPQPPTESLSPSTFNHPAPHDDLLDGIYPDIRPCYEDMPRMYERMAKDRLDKRFSQCSDVDSNTTSWCHKECILVKLGYISKYTVSIIGTLKKQRRYKVQQNAECGHNTFGQDLLGIDTKVWDEKRSQKLKVEKALYFEKVNQLGIRNFDTDPFRLKFVTTSGEDMVDERLEAQMRICRLFDISVEDVDCLKLSSGDMHNLKELLQCVETALTC